MKLLLLPVGLLLPALSGWLAIRLLERDRPVLQPAERRTLSVVLGLTLLLYLSFLGEVLGLAGFTRNGLLGMQVFTTLVLGMLWMRCKVRWTSPLPPPVPPSSPRLPRNARILLILLCAWTVAKLAGGFIALTTTPPYEDDVFGNWNMRGKMFFVTHELTLEEEPGEGVQGSGGVSSYPITVPLAKTWLALLAGTWDEGLVNSIHILWFLAALVLVFCALRRKMPTIWALAGSYALGSLPLYFLHGASAYADVFLSVHIFAVLSLLFGALASDDPGHARSFLRLAAFATGLLVVTKNEALIMYLPVLLLLTFLCIRSLVKSGVLGREDIRSAYLHFAVLVGLVLVPWVLFKWANNLNFGNAKAVSHLTVSWQPGVARAIVINTFFEGNWLLLFPLLAALMLIRWREAFSFPNALFSVFLIIIFLGQSALYFFTGISTEALNQTGYARGLVQLAPAAVTLLLLLARSWFLDTHTSSSAK